MKIFSKGLLGVVLAVSLLSQCGGRVRGADLKPLSAVQKEDFKDATLRLGAALTSISGAVLTDNEWPKLSIAEAFWFVAIEKRNATANWLGLEDARDIYSTLRKALKSAIADGRCETKLPDPLPYAGGLPRLWDIQSADLVISIKGERCPIHYSEAVLLRRLSERTLHGEQERKITLKDEALINLSGVKEIQLFQKADIHLSEDLLTIASTGLSEVEGTVQFQTMGERAFYLTLSAGTTFKDPKADYVKNGEAEIRYGMEFPDYTGELKFTSKKISEPEKDSKTESKFFLNDEEIPKKDFARFIDF